MKLKYFLPVICMTILAACNNSSDKDKEKKEGDSTDNKMSDHQMPEPGASLPALPAIPEGSKVMFKNLKQGDVVSSPLKIEMGVDVIKIDTAGPVVAGSGHHHIIVDGPDSLAAGTTVPPADATHFHFGKGQTEAELNLAPGRHRLTLQFADGLHRSYGGKLSAAITVTVKN